jgi:hypothetical protein
MGLFEALSATANRNNGIMIKPYFFIFSTFQHSNIPIFQFVSIVPADFVLFRDRKLKLFFQAPGNEVWH